MAYTVGRVWERKDLEEGLHAATIKLGSIRDNNFEPSDEIKEMGITKTQQISFLLETDLGASGFDNINQYLDKETFTIDFSINKMNMYSNAVGLEEGTVFNSIQEWIDFVVGKKVVIDVELGNNGKPRIKEVKHVDWNIPF